MLVSRSQVTDQYLSACVCVVEETIIALARLYQTYTFELPDRLLTGPLEVKQGVTLAPKAGVPVTVVQRRH